MKKYLIVSILAVSLTDVTAQDRAVKERQDTRVVNSSANQQKTITTESKTNQATADRNEETTSPAKSYIKKFWEYVEKMEAAPTDQNILGTNTRAATASINNIKIKDKSYNTAPLEAELGKWQQAYDDAKNGVTTQRGANNDLASLLNLLYQVNTNVAGGKELETKPMEIEQYKAKIAEMVALNIDPADKVSAAIINNVKPRVKADLVSIDEKVKYWEKNMNMMIDEEPTRSYHMMIQYELAHWDALRKGPFAEKAQLEAGYVKVSDLMKRIGSVEKQIANGKERGAEILKNTKMPPALLQNPATEQLFRQAFTDSGWKETIVKINLLDRDWKAIRNEITGVVEARTQRAAIAVKTKDGGFLLYNYLTIQQDFLGNAYSNQSSIIYHEAMPILQENIK